MFMTASVIYLKPSTITHEKKKQLETITRSINGWNIVGDHKMDPLIEEELSLDDYIFKTYTDNEDKLTLYVGYYHSTKKIGAAHDPMVCFPGQGWKITDSKTGKLLLKDGQRINYSLMIGQLGQDRELITYWFQAYDKTNDNTFAQKVSLFINNLINQGEDNAFIRITIPIGSAPLSDYSIKTNKFIEAFYPVFLEYIKSK